MPRFTTKHRLFLKNDTYYYNQGIIAKTLNLITKNLSYI
jgi:hypothetical protein